MDQTHATETHLEETKPNPRKKILLLCCLVAAILVVAYCVLCGMAGRGTIYPNVTISGVNVGGLTKQEAQTALEKAVQKQAPDESRGVVFAVRTAEGEEKVVEVPLSSVATDYAASIDRAWQVGNTLSFGARGGVYLKCLVQGETVLPVYQDSENLDTILDGVEQALGRDPVEPTWETNDTHLILTKGQPGNQVDRKAIQEAIFQALGKNEMVELKGAKPQFTIDLTQTLPGELDLTEVLGKVERKVQNARFDKAKKEFQVDQPGVSFDAAQAQTVFDGLDWGQSQEIPLEITQPETTVADLTPQLYQDVLGSCTTNISGSANRVRNIQLAAQYFSGTVLMPGENSPTTVLWDGAPRPGAFCPPPPTWAERRCRRRGAVSARALPQCIWPRCGQTWKLWNDIPTAISPAMSPMGWTPRFTMGRRTSDSETIRPSPFKWWALCPVGL